MSYVAAVDVGATNLRLAIVSVDGEICNRREEPIGGRAPHVVADWIGLALNDLVSSTDGVGSIEAVGLAFPGLVDPIGGRVVTLNPTAEAKWDAVPVRAVLEGKLHVRAALENDANAAALGEGWVGVARGLSDFVFIAYGSAFGAGLVIDGRLHRGRRFMAGEMSFFPMIRSGLTREGWEHVLTRVAGGMAADEVAADLFGGGARAGDLFDAARRNDEGARLWVSAAQEYIAMAVVYTSLFDPDMIVFGGGVANAQGEWFLRPIREMSARYMPGGPQVQLSTLGPDAQLLGAARAAFDVCED